jgi:transposase-like protein
MFFGGREFCKCPGMDKNSVSLSGLPGLCEGRQTGHIADAGIEFPAGFSEQQKVALEALVGGFTVAAAARAAGMHRGTVRRWLNGKEEFSRLLRQEQEVRRMEQEIQNDFLTLKAMDVLASAVEEGDLGASIAVLELAGLFKPGAFEQFTQERKEWEVKQ